MDATAQDSSRAVAASKYRLHEAAFLLLGTGAAGALLLACYHYATDLLAGVVFFLVVRSVSRRGQPI